MGKKISSTLLLFFVFFACSQTAHADLADGLMAYYPFDGNADDMSGNRNDGKQYGGVQYKLGIIGQSAGFDGIDDYIQVISSTTLNPIDQLSISFWVKVDGYTNLWSPIIHKGGTITSGYANREYAVWLYSTSELHVTSAGDGSSQQ